MTSLRDPSRLLTTVGAGARAGLCATLAMSLLMAGLQRSGALGRMPPRTIVRRSLAKLGIGTRSAPSTEKALSTAAHFAFGATQGALYALLSEAAAHTPASRASRPSAATGVPFGLLVWAANYAIGLPALGIFQPPSRDRPGRPTSMILAHVVYGYALSAVLRRLNEPQRVNNRMPM
jgi:uncharacterized membrane protein YagU involved in acid resistance